MQAKRINRFLADITANNNREWFHSHKEEYTACRARSGKTHRRS